MRIVSRRCFEYFRHQAQNSIFNITFVRTTYRWYQVAFIFSSIPIRFLEWNHLNTSIFFPYSALDQNLCAVLITHHPQQNLWIVLKSLLELFPFVNLGVWLFREPKRENRKKQTILGKKRQTFFYVLWIEFVEPARDYERAIWDIFHRLIFHLMHAKYQVFPSQIYLFWNLSACQSSARQPAMFPDVWIEVNTVHCILKMCFWKVLLVCKILRIHPFVNKMKGKHTNHNINRERTDTNV